jgi:hypothetical protein
MMMIECSTDIELKGSLIMRFNRGFIKGRVLLYKDIQGEEKETRHNQRQQRRTTNNDLFIIARKGNNKDGSVVANANS